MTMYKVNLQGSAPRPIHAGDANGSYSATTQIGNRRLYRSFAIAGLKTDVV